MTDDSNPPQLYNISRRRVLGGMGAIGLASAGAGLGTTAFFSDEEVYENNVLTAGALDLVVDWEEHYSDWSPDEEEGLQNEVLMSDPGDDAYVPFPTPHSPVIWIHQDDIDAFMDNTSIEAYPDTDDDGIQDVLDQFDECADFAQLDENLDPTNGRGDGKRSLNEDTVNNLQDVVDNGADADWNPLVNLDDVKPGDFGELTLSMHLCDNPGYIWLQGQLVEARENGHTEPEAGDADEVGAADEVSTDVATADVELLDAIQTMLWYDEDGDNVYEPGGTAGEIDVMLVFDRSGSMAGNALTQAKAAATQLVNALGSGAEIGLTSFANSATLDQGMTANKTDVNNAINALSAGGLTNHEDAIQTGQAELANNSRAGVPDIMVILTDGNTTAGGDPQDDAAAARAAGTEIFAVGFGSVNVSVINGFASDPDATHAYFGDVSDIVTIFGQISQILAGEECFFQGSLRDLLLLISTDLGIALDGNRASEFDEVTGDDTDSDGFVDANYGLGDYTDPNRDPYVASTTNALGLAWWLPVDHANEIQTDSVTFDLGFYTEQARHNDGAGQTPEVSAD